MIVLCTFIKKETMFNFYICIYWFYAGAKINKEYCTWKQILLKYNLFKICFQEISKIFSLLQLALKINQYFELFMFH